MPKTSFTRHAWERVLGRLSLSPAELAQILDWGLTVDIGREAGTTRVHRLFHSVPDQKPFVAVQDADDGAVITVLPLDYHEAIAWRVSSAAQEEARLIIYGCTERFSSTSIASKITAPVRGSDPRLEQPAPKVFRLVAYTYDSSGAVKVHKLGTWPADHASAVELLLQDDVFFGELERRITDKGLAPASVEVFVSHGNRGAPVRITLRGVGDSSR